MKKPIKKLPADQELALKGQELDEVLEMLHAWLGYDFTNYNQASLKRRLRRFMLIHGYKQVFDLKHRIINDKTFGTDLVNNLTVNYTEMFRDPEFFLAMRQHVLPTLASYPFIKVWHAGCASGEEVYSTAIIFHEAGLLERTRFYATDINPRMLEIAQKGIYPLQAFKEYTSNYQRASGKHEFSSYYTARYNHAVMADFLKANTIFSQHNLVSDGSFNDFNLILCRNVLIYFNRSLQRRVIKLFKSSLVNFGYMGLGPKETLLFSGYQEDFEPLVPQYNLFRLSKHS